MDVTPPTTTADTPDPLTAAVAASPKPLGLGLALVGVLGLVAAIYFGYQAYQAGKPPVDAPPELSPAGTVSPGYVAAALTGLAVALVGLGVGATTLARIPADDPAARRTEARTLILTAGGLLGLVAMAAGAFYLAYTFDVLTAWLDTRTPPKDAWKPVASLLVVLAGAGLAFLAAQPARAEERNNPFLRRLVYGGNLALSTLLLLLALVVGNVLAGLKVPNKLDTTESGFYSLSDATKQYLAELTKPVTLYTTIPEGSDYREDRDTRTLLDAMRDANPGKVTIKPLSPTLNRREIAELRNRFPTADLSAFGVLVVVGEGQEQQASPFLRSSDFMEGGGGQFGRGGPQTFTGEAKIVKELVYLSESKVKPAVYFVTGHGELDVAGGGGRGGRPASRLRTTLEKVNAEVRPLAFDLADPKVPADAAVVVLADPRTRLPDEQVAALRAYMTQPQADGKKGKLVVLSSPRPRPEGGGVADLGLDGLLAELGVTLGKEYVYTTPVLEQLGYTDVLGIPAAEAIAANNPVVLSQQRGETSILPLVMPNCRTVTPAPPGRAAGLTAQTLYETPEGGITWLDRDPNPSPGKTLQDMQRADVNTRREMLTARQVSRAPRPVAVSVSEGATGRAVVFGSGDAFADPSGRELPGGRADEVLAAAVNWLRDRPAVANIAAKDYRTYTLDRKASDVALVWLPVGATLFGVLALGLGVWVFRRK